MFSLDDSKQLCFFKWKFVQTDIRDTDSHLDSSSLFQVIAQCNLLFNNDSYKKSLYEATTGK